MIDKTEFLFVVEREKMIRSLHSNWEHLSFLLFDFQMDKLSVRRLLVAIEMVLFVDWSYLHYSRDHQSIIIIPSNEMENHPYSTDVLYYTAGFILQRLFVAKTEKGSFRYWFTTFAESNTMLLDYAIDEGLPTSIIEHCQLNNIFCPNQRFFHFIQIIEANYVSNFTLEIMTAYDDGSLIDEINNALKGDSCLFVQFKLLFDNIEDYDDEIANAIYDFIFLRFKRMRGKWFVKSMRAEHGGKSTCIYDFSTRGRVIAQIEVSKEKSIAVVNATETASLGYIYSAITTTLETNDRSLSDSESDNE